MSAGGAPLRFCIVSTFYPPWNFGGDGIYAHRLANGLARLGHKITVLHSPSAYEMLARRSPEKSYDDHPNVTVHGIQTPLGALGLLWVQQIGRPGLQATALRRHLHEGDYDVIHYNNVSLLGGPHAFRLGRGLKLCTLIEHWLVCPMHVLWKYDDRVCEKPDCIRCQIKGRRPPQWWRYTGLMRRATRHIDAFVGPSLFTMNMHRQRGLNGTMVQLPLFHPHPGDAAGLPHPNGGRPYFLFVGRLEKIKGVQDVIPLFRRLADIDLLIAGGGTYEDELKRLATGAANIRFVGRVYGSELQWMYRNAVATVVPSICHETFGVVVAESYSAGTPVIVRSGSSLREIVETQGGGLVYEDEAGLKEALRCMKADSELRERLARQGQKAYDEEYAEDAFLGHYLGVVRDLIQRKAAGGLPVGRDVLSTGLAGRTVTMN